MFAACIFEGAEDESTAAVVLHVVSQVLAGDVGRPALVRTLDGEPGTVVLVVLQREECSVKTGRQQEGEEVTLHTRKEMSPFWADEGGLTWMVSKTNSLPQYLQGCVRLGHSAMPCWDSSRRIILAPHLFSQ